jgi:hypothetical protein
VDYNTLIATKGTPGSIADFTNDGRISASAPTIVDESQDWIYQRLRHWRMAPPPVTGTFSTALNYVQLPSDVLELRMLMVTGQNKRIIRQRTMEELMASWSYDGNGNLPVQQPTWFAFDSTNMNFDSVPDQAYPYALLYYQMPARLSGSNTTNFLTQWCERLMRMVIMMHACEWTKEIGQGQFDRTYYEQQAMEELRIVQANSDLAKRASGGGWIEGGSEAYAGYGYGLPD